MKKIILILNHVMAGMGSDEQAQLPPGGKKWPWVQVKPWPLYSKKRRRRLSQPFTVGIVTI
ncbi:hypothetical protein EVI01_15580 [Enterococcus villorum]|uniref:Uncharacterized protein n=1 Tax=Enterococcus villorum TaxID=112904 RepID=A0A511J2J2_9ENTE|nr:hypothetical protein EVI01_15580 [Enterococcus villorum]